MDESPRSPDSERSADPHEMIMTIVADLMALKDAGTEITKQLVATTILRHTAPLSVDSETRALQQQKTLQQLEADLDRDWNYQERHLEEFRAVAEAYLAKLREDI